MSEDIELKNLERRVDQLIQSLESLRAENRSLRESHSLLLTERAELIEKTEAARTRVEGMISRLKVMEQDA